MTMLEKVVSQVLLGYLGRYFKDIQKHQLKITLWKGEVFLENVELSLEAFDYLQLPFALKEGRVGKLSIKIPWKKLGWDPIEIVLENVFLSASQRDDQEWCLDEIERREFAGKKAKLAAAELAKLSKRVCENQAGLVSYLTAKGLDSIQVSIRDFHNLYHDKLSDSAYTVFGLKLSSLRTMKQNPFGSSSGKGGQVNKFVEIRGLEFYCGTFHGTVELMTMNNSGDSQSWNDTRSDTENYDSILSPFDVSMSLSPEGWRNAFLSRGGRLTLIQAVLSSLPTYYLSLFKVPIGVAKRFESMMRNFFWSGSGEGKNDHLVSWEVVSRNRDKGGLGIRNLVARNKALLGKWLWRFPRECDSLWHAVIKSKYGYHDNGWDAGHCRPASYRNPWRYIAEAMIDYSRGC